MQAQYGAELVHALRELRDAAGGAQFEKRRTEHEETVAKLEVSTGEVRECALV